METKSSSGVADGTKGNGRGLSIVAALATLGVSAAMGSLAARRWRRAALWLATELVWYGGAIVAIVAARPRAVWVEIGAVYATRALAAVDAYFLVRQARAKVAPRILILGWLAMMVGAAALAMLVRTNVVEAFKVPSASMLPTLLVGDHFFVDKRRRDVRRGDVVVFQYPKDPRVDYVKRVIGVGGDTIEGGDQGWIVNGTPLPRRLVRDVCFDAAAFDINEPCEIWEETLDGRAYQVGTSPSGRARMRFPRTSVPEGTVFVVGDNRENSSDSRVFGPVDVASVKGRALFIWWSSGPQGLRRDRINQTIP